MNKRKVIAAVIAASLLFGSAHTASATSSNSGNFSSDRGALIALLQQQIMQLQAQLDIIKNSSEYRERERDRRDREENDRLEKRWNKCVKDYTKQSKSWKKKNFNNPSKYCRWMGHKPGNGNNNGGNNGGNGTTTDTTAPQISAINVGGISINGATITWNTNENTQSAVYLGSASPVGTSSANWTDSLFRNSHSASFTGLSASTTYYYVIKATDSAGNVSFSSQGSFMTTSVVSDTTAPQISSISVSGITQNSATLNWNTNELAKGMIYTSSTTPASTSSAQWVSGDYRTTFSNTLTGLSASTTYYYVIGAEDSAMNKSWSVQGTFTTAKPIDSVAPQITALSATSVTQTAANIVWTTDESSTSKVFYSTTTPVGTGTTFQVFGPTLVTSHLVPLSGLSASSTYYAYVVSTDGSGNSATSSPITWNTLP